jgi:hypothetical protein
MNKRRVPFCIFCALLCSTELDYAAAIFQGTQDLTVFLAHLYGFVSFSYAMLKHTAILDEAVKRTMQEPSATQEECVERYEKGSGCSSETISESYRLVDLMNNEQFCCLLPYFAHIMPGIDILYKKLKKICILNTAFERELLFRKTFVLSCKDTVRREGGG